MQEIVAYDSQGNSLTNLVQWDSDVYIYLSGEEITSAYKVHFFNNTLDEALVVNSVYNDGVLKVKIPNVLLTQPHIIIGYVSVVKNDEIKSLYCFKINVRKKPVPSTYIHIDTKDWMDAETILRECSEYANSTYQSAINAKTSETNATNAANASSESERNAKNSEQAAAKSATDAQLSAESANKSATNANSSAITAQKAKQDILDMTVSTKTLNPEESATVNYITGDDGHISVEYGIPKGYDGYTPQRGVDYYTNDDINDIVDTVVQRVDSDGSGTQHIHANKILLDSITDADKEKWDSAAKPVRILEITIPVANWDNGMQTVSNPNIDASDLYMYLISPISDCEIAYNDAFVRAKDIDTNSEIVFVCKKTPVIDLMVRILIFDATSI